MGTSIRDILTGHDEWLHREITVKGWVRTRRDSKAGLSFLHIHDGSGFATLQIIANGELANYETEIINLTAGCAVICTGTVVESQGQGQRVEIHARTLEVIGWVEDPETYPISPKQHTFEYLRDLRTCGCALTPWEPWRDCVTWSLTPYTSSTMNVAFFGFTPRLSRPMTARGRASCSRSVPWT